MHIHVLKRVNSMAKLYFRYGAMNCGKTASLLQVAYNYKERDRKIILIKPKCDLKGGNKVVSRIGISRDVDYLINDDEKIIEVLANNLEGVDCILADEAQFFKSTQIDELFILSKIYDIPVVCYGLKSDFKSKSFPGSQRLFELADELTELETICRCGKKARFNARIVNGEFVSEGAQVAIDGIDDISYEALCGKCYLEKVLKYEKDIKSPKMLKKN